MQIGTVLHGFALVRVIPVAELQAELHLFRHQKTGAQLLWTNRADTNKTFAVTFPTLPEDDTGVFHILEHSVLCGSEKYPVKEPFVDLLKGSMNTFLNAMTFPDATMYPLSSRNDQDFRNLVGVYLDAVFRPAMLEKESIFLQEGWRFEQDAPDALPHYVGVVLNEMKGAFSSKDRVKTAEINRLLYPDNCYGHVSGGDPKSIPHLTYQQFVDTYHRFYHPSHALFFLDGDVQLDTILSDIDSGYLCHYSQQAPSFHLNPQSPVPGSVSTIFYEIAPGEEKTNKACWALASIAASYEDRVRVMALSVLCDYMDGSNDAPLKREVLRQGLAQDVRMTMEPGTLQPALCLELCNMSEASLETARAKVQSILRQMLEEGLNREELTACLNRYEFRVREREEPYGVMLAMVVKQAWLYGGDPSLYLRNDDAFAALRKHLEAEDDYFATLVQELLLENDALVEVRLLPSDTLGKERSMQERQEAEAHWAAQGAAWQEQYARKLATLHDWQQQPDAPEDVAKLPHLSLEDVQSEPNWVQLEEQETGGAKVLRSPVLANGIVYLKLYFDLGALTEADLFTARMLGCVLGNLPTLHHSVRALQKEIKLHLGNLAHRVEAFNVPGRRDVCRVFLTVSCSVLETKVDEAIRLIQEVQLETQLNHPDRIRELVQQTELSMRQQMVSMGQMFAMCRALSGFSASSLVNDRVIGYGSYQLLHSLGEHFDEQIEPLIARMELLLATITKANRLTVGVTGNVSDAQLQRLIGGFPSGEAAPAPMRVMLRGKEDTALAIPAAISFACQGCNIQHLGWKRNGAVLVLLQLVSLSYLWSEVRVKGGAYGCGLSISDDEDLCFYSYRDPNADRTLDVYRKTSAFIRDFCAGSEELTPIIIGTMAEMTRLMSPLQQSTNAFELYFCGITQEQRQKDMEEVLHITKDDLLRCCDLLDALTEQGSVCVVGGKEILDDCTGLTML